MRKGLVSTTVTKPFMLLPLAFSRLILVPFSSEDSDLARRRRIMGEKVSAFRKLAIDGVGVSVGPTRQEKQ